MGDDYQAQLDMRLQQARARGDQEEIAKLEGLVIANEQDIDEEMTRSAEDMERLQEKQREEKARAKLEQQERNKEAKRLKTLRMMRGKYGKDPQGA